MLYFSFLFFFRNWNASWSTKLCTATLNITNPYVVLHTIVVLVPARILHIYAGISRDTESFSDGISLSFHLPPGFIFRADLK